MAGDAKTIQLGAGDVSVINVGESEAPLAKWVDLPDDRAAPYDTAFFQAPQRLVQLCLLGRLGDQVVLVDASLEEGRASLVDQLAGLGVRPEDVAHVVITHGHWDHFNATTVERAGRREPTFPNATYYLGRADWESDGTQEALRTPDSLESTTLGVLRERGRLELVDGDRALGPGVNIIATPGETPGHQIVCFTGNGQTMYCLGDRKSVV